MPAQPQWLLRLPEIIEALSKLETVIVDRAAIERLFAVRRRRAIQLMGEWGGYQVGRTFVVGRDMLLDRLRAAARGDQFVYEKRRRERVAEQLEQTRKNCQASRVAIRPAPTEGSALPAGIAFERGRLVIEYEEVAELLGKLYGLAQAASADFGAFEAAATAQNGKSA